MKRRTLLRRILCMVAIGSMLCCNVAVAAPDSDLKVMATEEKENLAAKANVSVDEGKTAAGLGADKLIDGSYDVANKGKDGMLTIDNVSLPVNITFTWEEAQTFNSVNMISWFCKNQAPSNWDVYVSENGTDNWVLTAASGDVQWESGEGVTEEKAIVFDRVENVKGMRVVVNNANFASGWGNKFAILELQVFDDKQIAGKEVESIEVTKKPKKTQYRAGEKLDLNGMEVTATYNYGTSSIVEDYEVTGFDSKKAGKQELTVSYSEKGKTVETTFSVTVLAADDQNLYPVRDDLNPEQWVYQFGDEFEAPELSDMWEPSYFSYWSHSSITPQSVYDIKDGVLSEIVNADSPYYDATTDWGFRNPGMSLGVKDYVHMYRDNLVQYRHMPTDDRYVTKYGYYELRAKLNPKDGSCAAWWMTGFQDKETDTAEIDIIECAGDIVNGKNKIGGWMYNWSDPKLTSVTNSPVLVDFDPSADYHVYGMEWLPGSLKFYVDGELMSTINQSPDYRMITWLSYNHHDSRTNKTFPKSWGIDYFRVWQDKDILAEEELEQAEKVNAGSNVAADAYASTVGISASHYKKNPPLRMNDGDENTAYKTPNNTSFPYYMYLDWTEPQTINTLTLKAQYSQAPTAFDIEYSVDGKHGWIPVAQNVKPDWQKKDDTVESYTTQFETLENVKYIRVKVNEANTTPGYLAVNELEASYQVDATPIEKPESYIANHAPYAAVTSSGHDVNYPVGDVADEVYLNEYRSVNNAELPYYITFNWAEGKTFDEVVLSANNCQSSAPYAFEVQVSKDGESNWKTVATVDDAKWEADNQLESRTVTFDQVSDMKGCRILINKANAKNGYFKVSEIEINETVVVDDDSNNGGDNNGGDNNGGNNNGGNNNGGDNNSGNNNGGNNNGGNGQKPDKDANASVKTGDSANIAVWFFGIAAALAGVGCVVGKRRRK